MKLQENSDDSESEANFGLCDSLLCRLYGLLSDFFSSTKEDEELYNFMYQRQKAVLEKEYKVWIGRLIILMALAGFLCYILLICLSGSTSDEQFKIEVLMLNYGLVSTILYLIISYVPNSTSIISTLIISFTLFTVTLLTTIKDEYRLSEFFIPAGNIVCVVLIIIPTQWKTNVLAYGM